MYVPISRSQMNYPHSWYVTVRNRETKKQQTWFLNGVLPTPNHVAEQIKGMPYNVDVLNIEIATKLPQRHLGKIPDNSIKYGGLRAFMGIEKEIDAGLPARINRTPLSERRTLSGTLSGVPLSERKPLSLR